MKRPIIFLICLLACQAHSVYAQWKNVAPNLLGSYNILYGGAISFKDGILWAGVTDVFNSLDSGNTWQQITTPLSGSGNVISDICFFSKDTGAIVYINQGAFITNDRGVTWNHILVTGECFGVSFARNGNELFVADRASLQGTISYTSDGGSTWTKQTVESSGGGAYEAIYNPRSKTGYVLSRSVQSMYNSHINISTDFGKSWSQQTGQVDLDSYSFMLDSCDASRVYITNEQYNETENGYSEIFLTTDNGQSWTSTIQEPKSFFSSSCSVSANAAYAGSSQGQGVFRSLDHGKSWKAIGGPSEHQDSRLLCAINDNIVLSSAPDGSIWRTTNSGGDSVKVVTAGPKVDYRFSSARIINDTPNVTIRLPIYVHHKAPMPTVDMIVHYVPGSLTYLGSFLFYGKSIDVAGSRWSGRAALHIEADDLNALPDSLVGYAAFQWYPYEFDCDYITFDSISSLVEGDGCSGTATAITGASFQGIIGSFRSCGQSTVTSTTADNTEPLFKLVPNPAGERTMIYSTLYSGALTLRLYDLNGKLVGSSNGNISTDAPMPLSVEGLATGVYHLQIDAAAMPPFDISFVHYR
ncbi:MAG TPA: T9SS type A sorting domain-containing protein [Candidatus Kapabacteria bacterium]|nr:T9SS type A sorting domain-containing protein [Candidatus Kapabacteria bacterium]